MKKKGSFVSFLITLMVIFSLAEPCMDVFEYLFIRTPPTMRKLEHFWHTSPQHCIMLAFWLILILIAVTELLKMLKPSAAASRPSTVKPAQMKTVQQAAKPRTTAKARAHRDTEAEEAIHCAHLTGRAKYLEQIDNYLKTGLIDKDEYRVLKNRYMNLDIPDEYH